MDAMAVMDAMDLFDVNGLSFAVAWAGYTWVMSRLGWMPGKEAAGCYSTAATVLVVSAILAFIRGPMGGLFG